MKRFLKEWDWDLTACVTLIVGLVIAATITLPSCKAPSMLVRSKGVTTYTVTEWGDDGYAAHVWRTHALQLANGTLVFEDEDHADVVLSGSWTVERQQK